MNAVDTPWLARVRGLFFAFCLLLPAWPATAQTSGGMDEIARGLAGLAPIPGMVSFSGPRFKLYADQVDQAWQHYQEKIGRPMQQWGEREIPAVGDEQLFYPFSGPDFLSASQLRPQAKRYVLIANQRAGQPVDPADLNLGEAQRLFAMYSAAWEKFGHLGFFLTNDLMRDTARAGVHINPTGILMAFAARRGLVLDAVTPIRVREDGSDVEALPATAKADWSSVRLSLRRGGEVVLLDYVYMDLSDAALNKTPAELAFIRQQGQHPVLFKAASHLPQNGGFVHIRQAVLAASPLIIQDETGIEYSLLAKSYQVQLYGRFSKPHHLFPSTQQAALAKAYQDSKTTRPLTFRVGYEKESGSSMQIAARGEAASQQAKTPQPAKAPAVAESKAAKPNASKEIPPTAAPALSAADRQERELMARLQAYQQRERTTFLALEDAASPHREYLQKLAGQLQASVEKMRAALPAGKKIILALRIGADGKMRGIELAQSSGHAQADQQALAEFPARPLLPPLPPALAANGGTLEVIFSVSRPSTAKM